MIRMQSTLLVILPTWAVFSLSLSLSPQILPILYQHLSQRTVNKTFWSNPRQTRICCVFRRNHACLQNHTNHNDARSILLQLKSSLPFSLFLFVWRLESTTTKSFKTSLLQRISTVYKPSIETLFEMEGQYRRIRRFAVGPVYPNKSLTMSSSDFVFRKYKQDSAFHVSGVLQLAKTGPLVTKNFSLLRLFPSDAMMAWRFYTPYDVNRTNLHILTAHGMSHILTGIGQLWSSRKNLYALVRSPNSKIMNQRIIDFNNLEKK